MVLAAPPVVCSEVKAFGGGYLDKKIFIISDRLKRSTPAHLPPADAPRR
jgi:hypothetical protein